MIKMKGGKDLLDILKSVKLSEPVDEARADVLALVYALKGMDEKDFRKHIDVLAIAGLLWKGEEGQLCLTRAGEALVEIAAHFRENRGTLTERVLTRIWDALKAGAQW